MTTNASIKTLYTPTFEQAPDKSWSAYVPNLPGVAVVGLATREKAEALISEGIEIHLAGMREDAATPPTPEQIDEAVLKYNISVDLLKVAKSQHETIKDHLAGMVEAFGAPPPNTEKSKRLAGRHCTATITYGTTVNVSPTHVIDLDLYLHKEGLQDLSPRFFSRVTKYSLVESATDVLKTLEVPRRVAEKIASLFGRCIEIRDKTPSLKVEAITPEKPVRKPRAKKEAA